MDGLIALVYARKLYDLAEGPQGPPGQDGEVTNAALEEKLEAYAKVDGSYESMTVGNAEQLVSNVRVNDKTPYLFRTAGGSVDIGDREYINGIVGGTVAWNQLADPTYMHASGTESGVTFTKDGGKLTVSGTATANIYARVCGRYAPISGHKVLFIGAPSEIANVTFYDDSAIRQFDGKTTYALINASGAEIDFKMRITSGSSVNGTVIPQLINLTQMFGSTIADYIYSLDQATAGAGVAWLKRHGFMTKPYYAYDAGTMKHVEGLVSHDMTGFNQWDEEWEMGYWDVADGTKHTSTAWAVNTNPVPCLPNTTYCISQRESGGATGYLLYYDANGNYLGSYTQIMTSVYGGSGQVFTTPANAYIINFYTNKANMPLDICINLAWDNSRNGEYEPYELHSYPLDSDVVLRGIPKLDANNNLYYDGDIYEPDGTVTRKYGIVDLGTLEWTKITQSGATFFYAPLLNGSKNDEVCSVCSKYPTKAGSSWYETDKVCRGYGSTSYDFSRLAIIDSDYVNVDANAFKSAMSGVHLVYELATPTTETADPYTNPQIVNDFGTEEFVISNTVAVPIPVGHNTDYPVNLVAKLEMAPNSPSGSGDFIVRQTNGVNEYVPLVIEDALPTMPSTAGSYKLTVTVADGSDPVLSWEAE